MLISHQEESTVKILEKQKCSREYLHRNYEASGCSLELPSSYSKLVTVTIL